MTLGFQSIGIKKKMYNDKLRGLVTLKTTTINFHFQHETQRNK